MRKFQISNFKFQISSRGNVWVGFLVLLIFMISLGLTLASDIMSTAVQAKKGAQTVVAQALADAGIEKAVWKLNNTGGSYSGETNLSFSTGMLDITVTTIDTENKEVIAIAYVPNKTSPKATRKVRAKVKATPTNENVSFHYALQAGDGGINVTGSSDLIGNLYSNGNITFSGGGHRVTGDVFAHGTVSPNPNPRVTGSIQTGVPVVPLPDIDIQNWKEIAATGGTIPGNYTPSGTVTMGPKEITGNLSMSSAGQKVNLSGPLYVRGEIHISGGEFHLSDSLGSNGTMVIADGPISINGGARFTTNAGKGYVLFISTATNTTNAIDYAGSATSEALATYAPYGGMILSGSGEIVATCGKTLTLSGSGEIRYKSGLANANFSGGPGGIWKIKEWQIVPD